MLPALAEIFAFPGAMAVTMAFCGAVLRDAAPAPVGDTVTPAASELQVIGTSGIGCPCWSTTMAATVWVAPMASRAIVDGEIATLEASGGLVASPEHAVRESAARATSARFMVRASTPFDYGGSDRDVVGGGRPDRHLP